jgi:hypothetical protein
MEEHDEVEDGFSRNAGRPSCFIHVDAGNYMYGKARAAAPPTETRWTRYFAPSRILASLSLAWTRFRDRWRGGFR